MTRPVEDLSTPAVLVDLDVLEKNIARQAERARAAGVRLRPHAKTHKCPEIARVQLAAGAAGISLAKTSEAEVFAAAGFGDIFIAYPVVGLRKAERLLALSDGLRLAVGCDSLEGALGLSNSFERPEEGSTCCSRSTSAITASASCRRTLWKSRGASRSFPGSTCAASSRTPATCISAETPEAVAGSENSKEKSSLSSAEALRRSGLSIEEVSVGSTPSARHAMRVAGVTECRPGNYVFHDGSQVALGTCALEDCAMTILATVVSVPAPDRAVVDAGSKTLSQDSLRPRPDGHGLILGTASRLQSLSEEHGVARVEEGDSFRVGQRVRILPNHACVVSNLHDRLYGVRNGRVETEFRIAARGRVE